MTSLPGVNVTRGPSTERSPRERRPASQASLSAQHRPGLRPAGIPTHEQETT
jgi:hypothetical protein